MRRARTSLLVALIGSTALLAAPPARAQEAYARGDVVLMAPDGTLLDYVPAPDEVRVRYNRNGQRVLVDGYGNLVAIEVPADRYFNGDLPGVDDGSVNEQASAYPDDPDFSTGAIPDAVTRQPLDEQPLPDLGPTEEGSLPLDTTRIDPNSTGLDIPPEASAPITSKNKAEIAALQVLLDRGGSSPGVIDGKNGSNVAKALAAWEQVNGEKLDPNNMEDILERLRLSGGLPFTTYTITPADAAGPYVAAIPEDYSQKALLPGLNYTSVTEMLAERFHMDENYLKEINPGVDFTIPGTIVKVVNPGTPKTGTVTRILADKARKQVFAYGESGELIAAYPASIGSSDTPSPSGVVQVQRIAFNPGYTYNPKINFQQGNNDKILNIPPGPNGPVGTVWIALSKPTYGIHGTPEPSKIGKTQSHGCIRLTNWDATELGKMVKPGVTVEFVD
ncbi:L,D-transpeptidase [Gellertiella hungarica]|uniref:Lipoprotein-anchoring transpeptidase ErfK/SrfK n=1 Tax=Gellertiella hungarica TaxID=1572859 RepID=A0A7W6J3X5_9HYPH|nr:L,D-transpeptidase [Gellertiella hungarica]MBB4063486.1 lipoprotein-anchoring transpeptidase ErfK/SrfK [Gellertiella hungarica]